MIVSMTAIMIDHWNKKDVMIIMKKPSKIQRNKMLLMKRATISWHSLVWLRDG